MKISKVTDYAALRKKVGLIPIYGLYALALPTHNVIPTKLPNTNIQWNWLDEAVPTDISFPLVEVVCEQVFCFLAMSI